MSVKTEYLLLSWVVAKSMKMRQCYDFLTFFEKVYMHVTPEKVVQRSSVKRMFLKISLTLQENTYARAFF